VISTEPGTTDEGGVTALFSGFFGNIPTKDPEWSYGDGPLWRHPLFAELFAHAALRGGGGGGGGGGEGGGGSAAAAAAELARRGGSLFHGRLKSAMTLVAGALKRLAAGSEAEGRAYGAVRVGLLAGACVCVVGVSCVVRESVFVCERQRMRVCV